MAASPRLPGAEGARASWRHGPWGQTNRTWPGPSPHPPRVGALDSAPLSQGLGLLICQRKEPDRRPGFLRVWAFETGNKRVSVPTWVRAQPGTAGGAWPGVRPISGSPCDLKVPVVSAEAQTDSGRTRGREASRKEPGTLVPALPSSAVAGCEVPGPLWTSSHSWGPGTHGHGHSQTTQGKAFVHIPSERGTHQLAVGPVVVRATQRARAGHPQPHPRGCRRRPATKCLVSGQWPAALLRLRRWPPALGPPILQSLPTVQRHPHAIRTLGCTSIREGGGLLGPSPCTWNSQDPQG